MSRTAGDRALVEEFLEHYGLRDGTYSPEEVEAMTDNAISARQIYRWLEGNYERVIANTRRTLRHLNTQPRPAKRRRFT